MELVLLPIITEYLRSNQKTGDLRFRQFHYQSEEKNWMKWNHGETNRSV